MLGHRMHRTSINQWIYWCYIEWNIAHANSWQSHQLIVMSYTESMKIIASRLQETLENLQLRLYNLCFKQTNIVCGLLEEQPRIIMFILMCILVYSHCHYQWNSWKQCTPCFISVWKRNVCQRTNRRRGLRHVTMLNAKQWCRWPLCVATGICL